MVNLYTKPVVDLYIDQHFACTSASTYLIWSLRLLLSNPTSSQKAPFGRVSKFGVIFWDLLSSPENFSAPKIQRSMVHAKKKWTLFSDFDTFEMADKIWTDPWLHRNYVNCQGIDIFCADRPKPTKSVVLYPTLLKLYLYLLIRSVDRCKYPEPL